MKDVEQEPTEERRVPEDEQPLALSAAEEAGTLPDEDRREEEDVVPEEPAVVVPCDTCTALDKAGVGTVLEKQGHGWKLKMVDGGTVILTEGQTITEALHAR